MARAAGVDLTLEDFRRLSVRFSPLLPRPATPCIHFHSISPRLSFKAPL